jgi:serine/threonine-protein kinase
MTAAADRHLLFGLLALQTGIIDQGQLVAAFQAWTLDKMRSLADILVARGDLNAVQRGLLEGLADQHLQKHGDVEKSLAAVPANRSTRASLAELGEPAIEATLARVARSKNGQATDAEDDDPDRTASIAVGSATSEGQRFRVLRPHARGVLGAVFVALDGELHREVALKQILEKHADDPVSRQRFVAEAEITGGLEHPGVVPVYGLGADAGGRPYYAMRLIKGDSLKEAIDHFHQRGATNRSPSPPWGEGSGVRGRAGHGARAGQAPAGSRDLELRKLLRRFLDVCNAIDYAHSRGVIHRDIKPANIIVGKHGETLVVDWGLAKAIGRADPSVGEQTIAPSSSGSAETLPGSALGTPAYMSPEQARSELNRLDPRSDVYNLGATLYCLLTGKPPFEGKDVGVILRAAQDGHFLRPSQLAPSLDKAVEAVCLKAMATQPEDRYPTPKALADDLDRWMADEPVTAWREPFSRRARRWARRNRTAVTAAAVALVGGVVGLTAVLAVQTQAKADLAASLKRETNAKTALAKTNAELTRSQAAVQARYDLAVEAIKTFHTGVSEDFLLKQEQFKEVRDRLLRSASEFYGKLGALLGKESDLASRRALWQANYEVARLTAKVGKLEDALTAHRQVLIAREALAAEPQADLEIKAEVGRSLTAVADLLESTGKTKDGFRASLALSHVDLGTLLSDMGKSSEAEAEYRKALPIRQKLADENPAVADFRDLLARGHNNRGILLSNTGRSSEAEAEYRKALAIRQKVADDNPGTAQFQNNLAGSLDSIGWRLMQAGKATEGIDYFTREEAFRQKLAQAKSATPADRDSLANCQTNKADALRRSGRLDEALAACERALALRKPLVEAHPESPGYRAGLGEPYLRLGQVRGDRKDLAGAAAAWKRACGHYDRCKSLPADHTFCRACCHASLAGLAGRPGSGVSDAEGADQAGKAMAVLRRAVTMGYRDFDAYRTESALDPLRDRPDFQALMMDLVIPTRPFAE